MFKGIFTALITPFKNGNVDVDAFCDLISWQIEEGVHGIVVCGTTGESPTLSYAEHKKLIELAVMTADKRVPIIAGATSNNTAHAIELAKNASVGDATLIAAPYYNKPTQEGIYEHYKAIATRVKQQIIVYNIPSRSGVDISNDTMKKIMKLPGVVGIKDSTGDLNRATELKGEGISLISGDDSTSFAFNLHGGQGCISATANLVPKMCAEMQNCCMKGDFTNAQKIQEQLLPLHKVLSLETNPIPVKYALSLMRKNISPELRLPLLLATQETQEKIKEVLEKFN